MSRFFHSMVVMGSGLALGCGGVATYDGPDDHGSGGAPPSGGNDGVETGGTLATGGVSIGSGGYIEIGDGFPTTSGGTSNFGDSYARIADLPCPVAQWDCSQTLLQCSWGPYYLPSGCTCDPSKPQAVVDCAADQAFVCFNGQALLDDNASVSFDCRCVPEVAKCSQCEACFEGPTDREVECGCADIGLK